MRDDKVAGCWFMTPKGKVMHLATHAIFGGSTIRTACGREMKSAKQVDLPPSWACTACVAVEARRMLATPGRNPRTGDIA